LSFDYIVYVATEDMLAANATSKMLGTDVLYLLVDNSTELRMYASVTLRMYASAVAQNLTRLNVSECIDAYATTFQTSRGSLILVTEDSTNLGFAYGYSTSLALVDPGNTLCVPDAYGWICGDAGPGHWNCSVDPTCSARVGSLNRTDWKPFGNKIEYCLSEQKVQQCTVEFSPQLAVVVIILTLSRQLFSSTLFLR